MRTADRGPVGARDTCVFSRVCEVVVLNHKDALLGRNLAGGVLRGPVPAARRDDAEKSQPEALRQQVVDDGVHGRAQVEENTWENRGGGKERETSFVGGTKPEEENLIIASAAPPGLGNSASGQPAPRRRQRHVSPRPAQALQLSGRGQR